ncbi:hypothetical protein B0H10DRAFT_2186892 [Mycena sp. CBHHK59/15]|nr:hypothetical protein B0H10DRAFT_2186892 [Mycena sp. CBHHK59/15]
MTITRTVTLGTGLLASAQAVEPFVQCRRSRQNCQGIHYCESIDPSLINVERFELDPHARDAVNNAQIMQRLNQGSAIQDKVHYNPVCSGLRRMVGDPPQLNAVRDRGLALAAAAEQTLLMVSQDSAVFPPEEYAMLQKSISGMVSDLDLACHGSMDPPDAAPLIVARRILTGRPGRPCVEINSHFLRAALELRGPTGIAPELRLGRVSGTFESSFGTCHSGVRKVGREKFSKTMGRETMRSQITNSYLKHMALRDILLPSIDDDDSIWVLLSKENDEILLLLKMLEESPSERAIVG